MVMYQSIKCPPCWVYISWIWCHPSGSRRVSARTRWESSWTPSSSASLRSSVHGSLEPKVEPGTTKCILEKYLQILTQSWMSNWPSSLSVSTWLLLLETFSMKEVNSTASVTRARHTARKCESASDGRARWCLNIYQCQMMLVVVVILLACWASFSSFIF